MLNKIIYPLLLISSIIIFLFLPAKVLAQVPPEFKADYSVEYHLQDSGTNLRSQVLFKIIITNLKSDVYVKKFTISFPKNFQISNLTASDDKGSITPQTTNQDKTTIDLEFSNPQTGKNSVNTFTLNFDQDNLFKINGNIWEVIIPTLENKQPDTTYKIVVDLPQNTDKKISIAKPKPDQVRNLPSGNQIIWNNVSTKIVYAVFGEIQYYQANLTYHIKNPNLYPISTEIAFPPDTTYQKIFLSSIDPKPTDVYIDPDGNFMGRYILGPSQVKIVNYSGVIEENVNPRPDILGVARSQIQSQEKYLLASQTYWDIEKNIAKISDLKTVSDDYYFTKDTLTYNFNKVASSNERRGADLALSRPTDAVCLEFTDLFVAIAREKGIMAREIEGYGFSQDQSLRPVSLMGDILHSWPEYYDSASKLWLQVDPTWENTSGIDYFNSFDLNHITFAIHGAKSTYPLPAGTYKTGNSRDILINPISEKPDELLKIVVDKLKYTNKINDKNSYKLSFNLINEGNTTLIDLPVTVEGNGLIFKNQNQTVHELPPYGSFSFSTDYNALNNKNILSVNFSIKANQNQIFKGPIAIYPYTYDLSIEISKYIFAAFLAILGMRFFLFRKKK